MDSVTTNEAPEIKLHFLDYWRVIRLRRSLILVVFLLCVMTSTLLTIWLPKQYSSMVQIQVQKDDPEVAISEPHPQILSADPYFLTTQFKIIESYRILTNVIATLHLDEKLAQQNGSPIPWSVDETFDFLQRRLSVEQTRMTSLIEISVRNQDPGMAAAIANEVAESYRKFRVDQWRESRGRGIEALKEKLTTTTNDLLMAQNKLDQLRTNLNVVDIYDQSAMSLDLLSKRLEDWDHQRVMAEADYLEYSNILVNLQALSTNQLGEALAMAYAHQADPELNELASILRVAKENMVALKQNYGPEMPAYKTAEKQLADSQAAYQNKIDAVMAGIKTRVNADRDLMQLYRDKVEQVTKSKNEEAQKDRPYYDAKAEVELKRRNCDQLQTLEMREIVEVGQPNQNVVVVCNPARLDKNPVWPKTVVIIPLGVIVGLIVGLGLAFFIEYLDTSVKTIDDVERSLQAPVLGVIPQNVGLILDEGAESPHAEAYRVLRTNLLFSRKNEELEHHFRPERRRRRRQIHHPLQSGHRFRPKRPARPGGGFGLAPPDAAQSAARLQHGRLDRLPAQTAPLGGSHSKDQSADAGFHGQRQAAQQFHEHPRFRPDEGNHRRNSSAATNSFSLILRRSWASATPPSWPAKWTWCCKSSSTAAIRSP